jgi:hypothetical protein
MMRSLVKLPISRGEWEATTIGGIGVYLDKANTKPSEEIAIICNKTTGACIACPYGQPGDRLWVRETWRVGAWDEEESCITVDYKADGYYRREWLKVEDEELFERLWQQSSCEAEKALEEGKIKIIDKDLGEGRYTWEPSESPCRWRPSIHMPRWASRITIEITDIRVERLQEITEEDAKKEGIDGVPTAVGIMYMPAFSRLWDFIHGKDSWNQNPWVWVIEFKKNRN